MRAIKKVVKMQTINVTYYDRITKAEITRTVKRSEFDETPLVGENEILIESTVLEEKEVKLTMSPSVYLKHATIEE